MIGEQIQDRYRILTELGRGGMGEVYLAEHIHLNRLEALKVLRANVAEEFAGRFRREARAMNRLRHPNIISVYDFGQLPDGRFYLSMEYAQGSNLRDILRKMRQFGIDRTVAILIQVAEAIDHAHSRGVIHRDLKPANLILGKDKSDGDLVKILDFGVAKIIAPEYVDPLPKTGRVIYGTPTYMAPELLKGVGDDPRSDIYSLGCMGFELLTGQRIFTGMSIDICQQQLSSPPPRLSTVIQGPVSPVFQSFLDRCLEKQPELRFQTGAEVAEELSRVRGAVRRPPAMATLKLPSMRQPTHLYEESATAVSPRKEPETRDPEHARLELQLALKRLAELIADLGCSDPKLVLAITAVDRADASVHLHRDTIEDLRREQERLDQMLREDEAALRFSLGELDNARKTGRRSPTEESELAEAIGTLDREFRSVSSVGTTRRKELDDREIELVAHQSDLEDQRDRAYAKLDRLLNRLLPIYQGEASVALLTQHLSTIKNDTDQVTGRLDGADADTNF